jgi:hypothetical protein
VAPAGHVQAETGLDVVVPAGSVARVIDAGRTLSHAAASRALSAAEEEQLYAAGAALVLNPPAVVTHLGLSYVPRERWELALRYAGGAWRLGTRWQFLDHDRHGLDLSAGLGVQRFTADFPVGDVIGVLDVNAFSRWSVDMPLLVGKHGRWYRLWGGPRLIYSRFSASVALTVPGQETRSAGVDGNGVHAGALAGVALGYRWLFFAFELSVARLLSTAHLHMLDRRVDADIGGWMVVPGLGLLGEF